MYHYTFYFDTLEWRVGIAKIMRVQHTPVQRARAWLTVHAFVKSLIGRNTSWTVQGNQYNLYLLPSNELWRSTKNHYCDECKILSVKMKDHKSNFNYCHRIEPNSFLEKVSKETKVPLRELKIIIAGKILNSENFKDIYQEWYFNSNGSIDKSESLNLKLVCTGCKFGLYVLFYT